MRESGKTIRQIAASMDRAASSISREVRRNGGRSYKPVYADEQAWSRRWRGSRLMREPELQRQVLAGLSIGWSLEQVSGRMALGEGKRPISAESIYRFIYAQIARTKDYSWRHYLPRGKSKRGWHSKRSGPMDHIKNRVSIRKRPAYIRKRCQPGHWESDLLMLSDKKSNVLVVQERRSRFIYLAKQDSKEAAVTAAHLKTWFSCLPAALRRSLTHDNGPEFSSHYLLHSEGVDTYFCDPRSPWQKGGIENMNGRLRRYIPLRTNPQSLTDEDLGELAERMNNTPRKCLGFRTPAEVFYSLANPLHFKCEFTMTDYKDYVPRAPSPTTQGFPLR